MPSPATVTCTRCTATAEVPEDAGHAPLWDAGWRWIGSQNLYSCPSCPPAVTVAPDGSHHRGPGAQTAPAEVPSGAGSGNKGVGHGSR